MVRLFKMKDHEGMFQSHTRGLLEEHLRFFKSLTSNDRLVAFTDNDGNLTLKLSRYPAAKDVKMPLIENDNEVPF